MLRRYRLPLSVLLAIAALSSGCSEGTTQEVAATPLGVEGSCVWQRSGGSSPQELTITSRPAAGDSLTSSPTGSADIALLANTLLHLAPATQLDLITLALTKDGNATGEPMRLREVRVALRSGAIIISQEEEPEMSAALGLMVETPQGVAATHFDAVCRIAVDQHRTRIVCASGSLSFQPNGGGPPSSLNAGSLGEWSAEQSAVVAAESNGAAQDELSEALAAVPKIRGLREARRDLFPDAQ